MSDIEYNYNCIITATTTKYTGGWIIKEHSTDCGTKCRPNIVISNVALIGLLNNTPRCFICRKDISIDNFETKEPLKDAQQDINTAIMVAKKSLGQLKLYEKKKFDLEDTSTDNCCISLFNCY